MCSDPILLLVLDFVAPIMITLLEAAPGLAI